MTLTQNFSLLREQVDIVVQVFRQQIVLQPFRLAEIS